MGPFQIMARTRSPEGLDLCVRVSGEVWSAAGVFMLLFGSLSLLGVMAVRVGAQIIQRSKQPTYTSSLIPDWISRSYYGNFGKVCILLIFDFLLLGAYQRDYDTRVYPPGFRGYIRVCHDGFCVGACLTQPQDHDAAAGRACY